MQNEILNLNSLCYGNIFLDYLASFLSITYKHANSLALVRNVYYIYYTYAKIINDPKALWEER